MSTEIVFQIKAFEYPDDLLENDKCYLVLQESGANNCRDFDSGLVSRSWRIVAKGLEYSVWGQIARWVGPFSGGMARFAGRRGKRDYQETIIHAIRKYGKAIKSAEPLINALAIAPELTEEIGKLLPKKQEVSQ